MPKTSCQKKAAHRKAQNKYVAKNPKAQVARVKKSANKSGTKASQGKSGSQAKGQGKNGSKMGRPRKPC